MGYSLKVSELEARLKDLDSKLEKNKEAMEKLKEDYDHCSRTHMATTEDYHALSAEREVLFEAMEELMGRSMEQGAELKVFDEEGGNFVSYYQESDEHGEICASRFVDGFKYVGEQACLTYP